MRGAEQAETFIKLGFES